jgi:hypothetical protein
MGLANDKTFIFNDFQCIVHGSTTGLHARGEFLLHQPDIGCKLPGQDRLPQLIGYIVAECSL